MQNQQTTTTSTALGEDPWQTTRVVKTLWPPQPGTVKLRQHYGAQLVCVRYRRDITNSHRYTTVEILVDYSPIRHSHVQRNKVLELQLPGVRKEILADVQAVGGKWNARTKRWTITHAAAKGLGLLKKR